MNGRCQVIPVDSLGNNRGVKPTFRASTTTAFAAAAGTAPFFLMYGKSDRTLIVQRIVVSGATLTAVAYNSFNVVKYSGAAPSDGTAVALTTVPVNSAIAASGSTPSLLSVYTAAPTAGTLVGTLESRRALLQSTTAAAAGIPDIVIFDFRTQGENSGIYLNSATEGIGLLFPAAPATAVTMSLSVEWTGEPYA
jgi:hypothetical protein